MNTIKIIRQINLSTYIVESAKQTIKSTTIDTYTVDFSQKTCTCPHYIYRPETFELNPCKHYQLVAKTIFDGRLKNQLHQYFRMNNLKVEKIIKYTKVYKHRYSVVYLLENGGKGSCFVNFDKLNQDKFFELDKTPESRSNGVIKFDVYINSNNFLMDRYAFGRQFNVQWTQNGWVREVYSNYGILQSVPNFNLYDALTSPVFPTDPSTYLRYIKDIEYCVLNNINMEDVETLTFTFLTKCLLRQRHEMTLNSQKEIKEFKKCVEEFKNYITPATI